MAEAELEELQFVSTYFSVPKDAKYDRSIFNEKRLSTIFLTPPRVNIPEIRALIKRIDRMTRKGPVYVVTGGFRHWFYQIELAKIFRASLAWQ